MKRIAFYAASLILLFSACSNDEKKITDAAMGYLNATANYKIDDAFPFASKETRENTLPFIKEKLLPITDTASIRANTPATIEITEIRIGIDSAEVDYIKNTPLNTSENTVLLIKEEGKWVVDIPLALPETITVSPNGAYTDTSVVANRKSDIIGAKRKSDTTAKSDTPAQPRK